MRITLNIDAELLAAVQAHAVRTHSTVDAVLEDALRRDLLAPIPVVLPDFAYAGGLQPGVDLHDKRGLAALLGEAHR